MSEPLFPPAPPETRTYRVITISFYPDDLRDLDAMVAKLKARGCTRANRSALLREAMRQCDLDKAEQAFKGARR